MRGPFRCALATLLALTMSLPSANTRGDESFAVSASTELLQSGLADHSYDQFLHTLFNSLLTRVGDHTPIRVNEIARANLYKRIYYKSCELRSELAEETAPFTDPHFGQT